MDGAMWLPEFDQEFGETRKALERIPEEKFDWKPHEKSWSLHDLAAHVAEVPQWIGATLTVNSNLPRLTRSRILCRISRSLAASSDGRRNLISAKR